MKLDEKVIINNEEMTITWCFPVTGQKNVYKVKDYEGKESILKIATFHNLAAIARVYQEVEILKKIDSPYFPKIYYSEIDQSNKRFLILEEYISGTTLKEKLIEYNGNRDKSLNLFKKLIIALDVLWKKDIVHRDLKPENIILKENGNVVILDLGIAKDMASNLTNTLSSRGESPFSSYYAAPEQLKKENNLIDWRTDLFVLGILLGEAYSGKHPFDDGLNEINFNISNLNYKNINDDKINSILKKCLAKPFKRFNKVEKILNLLD